jgi:hypothetical protein
MREFTVIVTRNVTESTTVTVDADNEEVASEKALGMVLDFPNQFGWEVDDNDPEEPYITDVMEDCPQEAGQ